MASGFLGVQSIERGVVGTDALTQRKLSTGERIFDVATGVFDLVTAPLAIGAIADVAKAGVRVAANAGRRVAANVAERVGVGAAEKAAVQGAERAAESIAEQQAACAARRAAGEIGCFAAGSMLVTLRGLILIELLREGDYVLSQNEDDPKGLPEYKAVLATHERFSAVRSFTIDGQPLRMTEDHPLYALDGRGWVAAFELKAGDRIQGLDGRSLTVEEVDSQSNIETVYNLTVADYHTFFVGGEGWKFAVWVHNLHGNCLLATGTHEVNVLRNAITKEILRFGETGRGYMTRFAEWQRVFAKKGIDITVDLLQTVEGKLAARQFETRYINTYRRIFGKRPPFNFNNH